MSKEVNHNIADRVAKENNDADDKKSKRKRVSKAKARSGRIKAEKKGKK